LLADLVPTDQGPFRVKGTLIDLQDIFHAGDELGVGLGRDAPTLLQPGFERVFF
jgi:hypothetical protein